METKAVALKALVQASMFGLVILVILLLMRATQVLLVVYAGLLLAVLFHGLATWIARKLRIPEKLSLVIAILLPITLLAIGVLFIAPDVADQAGALADRLPQAMNDLKQQLLQSDWTRRVWENKDRLQQAIPTRPSEFSLVAIFFLDPGRARQSGVRTVRRLVCRH